MRRPCCVWQSSDSARPDCLAFVVGWELLKVAGWPDEAYSAQMQTSCPALSRVVSEGLFLFNMSPLFRRQGLQQCKSEFGPATDAAGLCASLCPELHAPLSRPSRRRASIDCLRQRTRIFAPGLAVGHWQGRRRLYSLGKALPWGTFLAQPGDLNGGFMRRDPPTMCRWEDEAEDATKQGRCQGSRRYVASASGLEPEALASQASTPKPAC